MIGPPRARAAIKRRMRMTMKSDRWTRRAMLMLMALTAALSGCTTYVTTQVTAFSDWSGNDASRNYAFTRSPAQQNSLEQ
jgi:hypothetical protein